MGPIEFLKKLPIDLGQRSPNTRGKLIGLELVPKVKQGNALDVGCGTGMQSEKLRKMGYEVTGIDKQRHPGVLVGDVNNGLPFKDCSFDLVWCSEVIEHLDDPAFAVSEFRRILKPGGRMIITTPNSYCVVFRTLSLFGLTPKRIQNKEHKHFFEIEQVRELFPSAEIFGFFPYGIVKFRIRKFVGALSPTFVVVLVK